MEYSAALVFLSKSSVVEDERGVAVLGCHGAHDEISCLTHLTLLFDSAKRFCHGLCRSNSKKEYAK